MAELQDLINAFSETSGNIVNSIEMDTVTKVLYPNGTEEEPGTIGLNSNMIVENPFPNNYIYVIPQVKVIIDEETGEHVWYEPGWSGWTANTGYGLTAGLRLPTNDICVQAGNNGVASEARITGCGYEASATLAIAPFRLVVTRLGKRLP